MSIPAKTIYKTTNLRDYNGALRQRGSLTVWFDPAMVWEAVPSGKRGRQQTYSDAAMEADNRRCQGPKRDATSLDLSWPFALAALE